MWRYVKIPKAIALLAFLLPWMTVSCSNVKVVEASGWELVLGKFHVVSTMAADRVPPSGGHLNTYLLGAVAMIVLGLALSFLRRYFAVVVVATSLGALALIWAGANQYSAQRMADAAVKGSQSDMGTAISASMFRVDWQIGYWVALASLAAAAVLAFLAIRDTDTR